MTDLETTMVVCFEPLSIHLGPVLLNQRIIHRVD